MTLDLLIPFGILFFLVVYLIYSRAKFEKNIVKLYEDKLEEWKKHSKSDEKIEDNLRRAKFEIYKYGIKDEEK